MRPDEVDAELDPPEESEEEPEGGPGYAVVPELDRALALTTPSLDDYLAAASSYVLNGRLLPPKETAGSKSAKAAQTALSKVLALGTAA